MMAVDDMRPVSSQSAMVDIKEEHPPSEPGGKSCPIHSGHFMVSRVHDVNNDDDDEEEVASPFDDDVKGFNFLSANRETSAQSSCANANTQSVGIDASLTKLFQCMTLAYSGKITSPRWKQFRGIHLTQKQRIRLNNLIWREWHMQYIYGKMPIVCQFATPLSDHIHSKPEAVVLEGKYWKRQLDTVTAEYKKWRRYFKDRIRQHQHINFSEIRSLNEAELLERVKDVTFISHSTGSYVSNTDLNLLQVADMMDMDFSNELFANLNQPFAFPNPRELSQLGYADFIQPGLVQLQPNLEEFMDIDSMQELFNSKIPCSFASAFVTDSSPNVDLALGGLTSSELSLENFLTNRCGATGTMNTPMETIGVPATSVVCDSNAASFALGNRGTSQNVMLQLTTGNKYPLEPETFLLGTSLSPQGSPQTFTIVPTELYSNIQNIISTSVDTSQRTVAATPIAMSSADLLTQLLQQHKKPSENVALKKQLQQQYPTSIQPAPSLNKQPSQQHVFQSSISSQSPILVQTLSTQHHHHHHHHHQQLQPQTVIQSHTQKKHSKINKANKHSGSIDSVIASAAPPKTVASNQKKKDGPFIVPTAKPLIVSRKNRVIAPAPPVVIPQQQNTINPSSSSQASYLAELLKSGTYPGAVISVKKEPHLPPVASSPIKTTTNLYQQSSSQSQTFSQHTSSTPMSTVSLFTHSQAILPSLSDSTISPLIASQDLNSLIMSSGIANLHNVSSAGAKESSIMFSNEADSKVISPVNHLPKSPVASPPLAKRTPSPLPSMDTSNLVDPLSPFSTSMPMSPSSLILLGQPESPGSGESYPLDNKKAAHLSAEQKRRCSLKTGFDMLQQLVPSLSQNPKVSKATMLQKTAEYCKKLKVERSQMQKEATILKQEIDALNAAISNVQSQLPETGVPVTRQRKDQMKEMFDEYVRVRTNENSKFWIFSMIMNTLFDSYCNTVSTASLDELIRTSLTWLDQSCSLVTLRPNVLNALRKLSTSTPILTEPQRMKEHALQAVTKQTKGLKFNVVMTK